MLISSETDRLKLKKEIKGKLQNKKKKLDNTGLIIHFTLICDILKMTRAFSQCSLFRYKKLVSFPKTRLDIICFAFLSI